MGTGIKITLACVKCGRILRSPDDYWNYKGQIYCKMCYPTPPWLPPEKPKGEPSPPKEPFYERLYDTLSRFAKDGAVDRKGIAKTAVVLDMQLGLLESYIDVLEMAGCVERKGETLLLKEHPKDLKAGKEDK